MELVQATSTILSIFSKNFYQEPKTLYQEIPREILPIPIEYTLEVIIDLEEKENFLLTFLSKILFWGIRGLRPNSFLNPLSQTKVIIEIEIGKETYSSTEVGFGSLNVNFNNAYQRFKIVSLV